MSALLASVPVLLVGALVALLLRSNRVSAAVALSAQAIACALVWWGTADLLTGGAPAQASLDWPQPIDRLVFRVDALSAFFLAWSLPMTLGGTVYAIGYLQPYLAKGRRGGPHFALLTVTSLSFILIYCSQNALLFLLGWEVAAVAAWLMVIWDYRHQKIRFAGFNYLVSTHVGLFVLVAAFMLLHSRTNSMDLESFGRYLATPSATRATIFLLLGASFALKSAFVPFHTWLPRAHAAAPAHVSALMSGVIHKAGLFAFLRFTLLMGEPEEWMGWAVLAFGCNSALFGVLFTATQRDLKRLLGYSSTENVGIVAIAFGLGYLGWTWQRPVLAACGFAAGLLHVLNHALFKCLLFYAAGAIARAVHTVDIERLGGLIRSMPRTAGLFLLGALAIAGLPPLNGFVSEVLVYTGLLAGGAPTPGANVALVVAAAILAFVGAVSTLAMTRAFGVAFLGHARAPLPEPHDPPSWMSGPMFAHAAGALAVGLVPELGLALIRGTLGLFPFAGALEPALAPLSAITWASRALALTIAAALALRVWQTRAARQSATWGCGYTAPSPRMQYTGSGFSEQLAHTFETLMPALERKQVPTEPFPQRAGHVSTHHADPVEQRVFEVLGRGEDFVAQVFARIPEHPTFAFGAGLAVLCALGAWLMGGALP